MDSFVTSYIYVLYCIVIMVALLVIVAVFLMTNDIVLYSNYRDVDNR